jgi:hypothetical protein
VQLVSLSGLPSSFVSSFSSVFPAKLFAKRPAVIAVINAERGLKIVIIGSISAYVIDMESIPVSGVEIRKERVAPLLAPCFFNETAAGNTAQEHRGKGIPKIEAFRTEPIFFLPRCLKIFSDGMVTFNNPATKKPTMM